MEIITQYLDDSSIDPRLHLEIDEINTFPICLHAINAREYSSVITREPLSISTKDGIPYKQDILNVMYICPKCKQSFLAKYTVHFTPPNPYKEYEDPEGYYDIKLLGLFPTKPKVTEFSELIQKISPKFVQIYNEALHAETLELFEIAGPGYRKAFEYLIKDYLIEKSESNEEKEKIKKLSLMQCINNLESHQIKAVAKRVTWLGNDQTHYTPLFEEYDISDLKSMINITISWITILFETEEILKIEPRK